MWLLLNIETAVPILPIEPSPEDSYCYEYQVMFCVLCSLRLHYLEALDAYCINVPLSRHTKLDQLMT